MLMVEARKTGAYSALRQEHILLPEHTKLAGTVFCVGLERKTGSEDDSQATGTVQWERVKW